MSTPQHSEDEDEDEPSIKHTHDDSNYLPSQDSIEEYCQEMNKNEEDEHQRNHQEYAVNTIQPWQEEKYLVFRGQLLELFRNCPVCMSVSQVQTQNVGSLLIVQQTCTNMDCCYRRKWRSQPFVGNMPAGNLCISSAILLSGSMVAQSLRIFKIMRMLCIGSTTYFRHQMHYIIPSVIQEWRDQQEKLVEDLHNRGEPLALSGDARCDSPGHCAKYGAYSIIEQSMNKVLDVQLVQSSEVQSSSWCEHEGLQRTVRYLTEHNLQIGVLITDRHKQNNAWIRKNLVPNGTQHYFDVWHVAKGLGKKITALAKQRDCEDVGLWRQSVTNHMYWVAASTPDGDPNLMEAKWRSVANHIQDIHEGHGDLYPECAHGRLDENDRNKQWLQPHTKAGQMMEDLILNKYVVSDVRRLSPKHQTSTLEAFHSLIIRFAPKHTGFGYLAMMSRLFLAALHYNENAHRLQAVTADGRPRFSLTFPKSKKGGHSVRKEKCPASYDYTTRIVNRLFRGYADSPTELKSSIQELVLNVPPPLAAGMDRPNMADAVAAYQSRFHL